MSLQRFLAPFVDVRKEEAFTAVLMFVYSFLAMTAYNIIQPLTRSKVIQSLGAVNVPWVILGSGLIISLLMLGYTRVVSTLPRRWALPITQVAMAVAMLGFWFLFRTGAAWVSVAFYVWGALLGILLISQFWTLANGIYDPRQAKRVFGFVGGGVMLGGMTGSGLTALIIEEVGTNALLLLSAATLLTCGAIVAAILGREQKPVTLAGKEERGVTMARAMELLRGSRQIQIIAVVISFGAFGAALLDQQVNMAAEMFKGAGQEDSIGAFLAQIRFYTSAAAFVIQVWITPSIHRYLGIGFALLILPTNLSITAAVILLNNALWAPALARVTDQSFRYTVDKTTREVLFLPLPSELRQEVKPFVDVTVDRMAKAAGALADPRADPAMGIRARVEPAEHRQPHARGDLGLHGGPRQARVPGVVSPQHRAANRAAGAGAARCRRSLHHRDAGAGAGPPRCRSRGLRHRRARVARQARPGHPAAALS